VHDVVWSARSSECGNKAPGIVRFFSVPDRASHFGVDEYTVEFQR